MNELEKEYHKLTTSFFTTSLVGVAIFAVPAFLALFVGRYIDATRGSGKLITFTLLAIAFVFSWTLILKRNSRLVKKYKDLRERMKKEEEFIK